MGRKHYSGKELIYQKQLERQRQQGQQNTVRQRVHEEKSKGGKRQWLF